MEKNEIIKEIVENINNIWNLYNHFDKKWINSCTNKINLSSRKKQIDWIYNNENSIEVKVISDYYTFLRLNELEIKKYINCSFRAKNIDSINKKIRRYCRENKEKGKVPISKCLNDLLGFRQIINFHDLNNLKDELENINDNSSFLNVKIVLKNNKYKAIHIYFQKDNFSFPWELQLWLKKDRKNNEKEHKIKYGK